jgi:hypothetical protein
VPTVLHRYLTDLENLRNRTIWIARVRIGVGVKNIGSRAKGHRALIGDLYLVLGETDLLHIPTYHDVAESEGGA